MHRNPRAPVLAVATVLACRVLCAQHVHPQASPGSPGQLPILVDGSKTPDQIPDALAYQHYFTAIAAHPSPSAQEQARQAAQLLVLHLSPADQQVLIASLAPFRTQLDQIEAGWVQLAGAPTNANAAAQFTALRAQQSALAAATLANLRQSLTSDGASSLDQYVKTHVKAHIVIYGTSQM
jgi:hypothetical protein